jgi:hypothetical protein
MTKDDVIRLAKKVGMVDDGDVWFSANNYEQCDVHIAELEAFAKLVAEHERDACAKVCENIYTGEEACGDWPTPEMCAEAIRARGQA